MDKQFYFLSPVEVVRVTRSNMEEAAEWCGGVVAETPEKDNPNKMEKYVWVPTPETTKISWAFPGMYITKRMVATLKGDLRVTWAIYRKEYFERNYFDSPLEAVDKTWEREIREGKRATHVSNSRTEVGDDRPKRKNNQAKKWRPPTVDEVVNQQKATNPSEPGRIVKQRIEDVEASVQLNSLTDLSKEMIDDTRKRGDIRD